MERKKVRFLARFLKEFLYRGENGKLRCSSAIFRNFERKIRNPS